MIYGLIPVGGKGTRLALPYSKEMLPQKHYDYYNPVINHTVEKMILAGASSIYMVHGTELKKDIVAFYKDNPRVFHVIQKTPSFAGVLSDFVAAKAAFKAWLNPEDKVLFGLPDSVYNNNPFVEMLTIDGIVCGLFKSDDNLKVDRPSVENNNIFQVKTAKNDYNMEWFWGVLKFDGSNLLNMVVDNTEIGYLLNREEKTYVYGNEYIDLGTWLGYNKYMASTVGVGNVEVEKKYAADEIDEEDFINFVREHLPKYREYTHVTNTTDYYYTNANKDIEFIRYRDGGTNSRTALPNITIKNFNKSQLNRFELTIPLTDRNTKEDILHFLSLLDCSLKYKVKVTCHIFTSKDAVLVFYWFYINETKISIIELELKSMNFNILTEFENTAAKHLQGFSANDVITVSKFQMIGQQYGKN